MGGRGTLEKTSITANFIVSKMNSGPRSYVNYSTYLANGLYSCTTRALLVGSLIKYFFPNALVRRAGIASIPRQVSHSVLEIWLPQYESWAFLDSSSGIYFTSDGTVLGRILSMSEVFSNPWLVDWPGPIAPKVDRTNRKISPRNITFSSKIGDLIGPEPGYFRNNFPLKQIILKASSYGRYNPEKPSVNHVYFNMKNGHHTYTIYGLKDGKIEKKVVRDSKGKRLSWLNRVGISEVGLNLVQLYHISGLDNQKRYSIAVETFKRRRGFNAFLAPVRGCRIESQKQYHVGQDGKFIFEKIKARFVSSGDEADLILFHNGKILNDTAFIKSISLNRDFSRKAR